MTPMTSAQLLATDGKLGKQLAGMAGVNHMQHNRFQVMCPHGRWCSEQLRAG